MSEIVKLKRKPRPPRPARERGMSDDNKLFLWGAVLLFVSAAVTHYITGNIFILFLGAIAIAGLALVRLAKP